MGDTAMKKIMALTLMLLVSTVPGRVAGQEERIREIPRDDRGPLDRIPDLNGTWYMNGDEDSPCEIIQPRPDGRAVFINENGSRARGFVRRDHVWIPKWTDGRRRGLRGRIRGDRIVWPNGTYWSR
jgi:hypothetical protein